MDAQTRRARFEQVAPALIEPLRRFLVRRTDPATADDVLSEALLVCWRRVEELPEELLPWAYAVARNCLANAERSARRQQRLATRISLVDRPPVASPGPGDEEADGDAEIAEALGRLREEDADLLRLWAWEGLEAAGIATVLGITPNAASIRLHRARQKLREQLDRQPVAGPRKNAPAAGHEGTGEGRKP